MSHELRLAVHATPGARRTEAAGAYGQALRVRLAAPPVDGKANAALLNWAAEAFGLPKSRIALVQGAAGRRKLLAFGFDTAAELAAAQQKVVAWMGACEGSHESE